MGKGSFNIGSGRRTWFHLKGGSCIFRGKAIISRGSNITVEDKAILEFGAGFSCNANFVLSCSHRITFGNDCLIGWNCTVIDGDGHKIEDGAIMEKNEKIKEVWVGNHVWLGAESAVLKATRIADNSVVGFGAVVSGRYDVPNSLIVSSKATVAKTGVIWNA